MIPLDISEFELVQTLPRAMGLLKKQNKTKQRQQKTAVRVDSVQESTS